MFKYFRNVLISLDQFVNTIFGGDPDETLSSRMGKNRRKCFICDWFCVLLDKFDWAHCEKSIEPDEGKDEI